MLSELNTFPKELADVLDQLLIVSSKFDIAPETLLKYSEDKLKARFKDALDEEQDDNKKVLTAWRLELFHLETKRSVSN